MIDWWLSALFNFLVFTLGFHTYLAHILKSKKQQDVMKFQTFIMVLIITLIFSYFLGYKRKAHDKSSTFTY